MDILFIEDEKDFAQPLQRLLELNHYSVDLVSTGEKGIGAVKDKKYDIIILDIMLSGLDGFEVAQKIRQKGILTPIIMLTARNGVGDRVRGLDSGGDDYLVKPFAFEELFARLRSLTRRKPQLAKLQIADLELNLSNCEVKRDNKLLKLNKKEYQLLRYLLENEGRLVSRQELGKNIWAKKRFKSNTIDVYIQYLRQKIDKGHKNKLIHTIRGRGYKIQEIKRDK